MNIVIIVTLLLAFATSSMADELKNCQTYSAAKGYYKKNDCERALPLLLKSLSDCKPSDDEKVAIEKAVFWCKKQNEVSNSETKSAKSLTEAAERVRAEKFSGVAATVK